MNILTTNYIKNITTLFTQADKEELFLSNPPIIDNGIRSLVDAINKVDVFFTMNSCQGSLVESERSDHCPRTYIDFYVLEHQYYLADMFFGLLSSKFGAFLDCKLTYEPDYDINEEDEAVYSGFVNLRYGLEIPNGIREYLAETVYKEIVDCVNRFAISIKETDKGGQ